ncbi:hypothetical protein J2W51_003112 [Tardiphaga robiniae]|jgi:hypothetical protein|nr:hypothetical protein [Tardiphaga robiniae]
MNAINLADAKTHLSELVDRVEAGDSIASPGAESRSRGSRPWPGRASRLTRPSSSP